MSVVLSGRGLNKAYGVKTLFSDVSLTLSDGDRVGLLGINGTGKSTLLRVLAGLESVDGGIIERRRDARILYLAQEPKLDDSLTPRQIVTAALREWQEAIGQFESVSAAISAGNDSMALLEKQHALSERVEHLGGWERGHVVEDMLRRLSVLEPDRPVGNMSGGERRRVALAEILVAEPALAILDEPTNHLDADTIEWLEGYLRDEFHGAVLMVTHDRYVLDALATRIVELENGSLHLYQGNYAAFLEQKAERMAQAERAESNRLNFLRREIEWLRRGPQARTTKQKARIGRAEAVIAVEGPKPQKSVKLEAMTQRLGNTILELHDVTLVRGDKTLVRGLTLHMAPGERIGIVGPNGVGKTSLLQAVSGELEPTSGRVVRGLRTRFTYFDQARAELIDDWSVFDNVAERHGAQDQGGIMVELSIGPIPLRSYLERFLFDGHAQRQKVGALSGGERARVALAKSLKSGANLLLLDEPTNDLDTATLGALEELLDEWPGCALIVSHDRYFLNRVATSLLVFEDGGKVVHYPGNYETYRALKPAEGARAKAATAEAKASQRVVDKKPLTYAERLELDGLLARVSSSEATLGAAEATLADPEVYVSRRHELPALQKAVDAARTELEYLTARWEELEARRDQKK